MVLPYRERNLKIFQREPIEKVLFQPRFMYWFNRNRVFIPKERHDGVLHDNTIPDEFFGLDSLEMHQALNVSIRYCAESLGMGLFYQQTKKDSGVKTKISSSPEGESITTLETPVGTVRQKSKGGYTTEHYVKTPEDMEPIKYMLDNTTFHFNPTTFEIAEDIYKETGIGIAQGYYSRSPFMKLILNYVGFENTVILLARHKKATEELLKFMSDWDDRMYDVLVDCPVKLLNFGENIDGNLISPRYFKKYLVPYWNERVKQLRDAGKFSYAHFDGSLRDLIPLIKLTDFDGIEAATPLPQGDVTVAQIKEGLGDKILLDGIPATLCMPHFPESRLEETVNELLELFAPNLILGISDELPPNANISRFKLISKIVDEYKLDKR